MNNITILMKSITKFIKEKCCCHATSKNELKKEIINNVCVANITFIGLIISNNILFDIFFNGFLHDIVDIIAFLLILYSFYVLISFPMQFQHINKDALSKNDDNFKKTLAKNMVTKYLLHLIIAALISFIGFIIILNTYDILDLHYYPILYSFLHLLLDYFPLVVLIYTITIVAIITFIDFQKPLSYIDTMFNVIQQLSTDLNQEIHLNEELYPLQDKLNTLRLQSLQNQNSAKESEKRKEELIAYLAHDLKTPLTSVIGYLSLLDLEKDISEQTRQHYINIALDKSYRVEELMNELFEITHFNITQMELNTTTSDIYRLIDQTIFEFKPMLDQHNLTFEFSHQDQCCLIPMDPDKMQRVFDNLIKNALNYAYENSTITLTASISDSSIDFIMSNNGPTIHPNKLERLFDPFYRVDSSRTSANGGSGLGLAIVKEIVSMHHGSIHVSSANEVISFYLSLPLS